MANELQGAVSRLLALIRILSRGVSFAGAVTRRGGDIFARLRDGGLSLAGAVQRTGGDLFSRTISSTVSISGVIANKAITKTKAGILSLEGAYDYVVSEAQQLYDGAASSAVDLAGAVSNAYTLARTYAGAISLDNLLSRAMELSRLRQGAMAIAGAISRLIDITHRKTGALSLSGALTWYSYEFTPLLQGVLSFASRVWRETPLYGFVYRQVEAYRASGAGLSLEGSISYLLGEVSDYTFYKALTFSGSVSTYLVARTRLQTGRIVSMGGGVPRLLKEFGRTKAGILVSSGRSIRTNAKLSHLYAGALNLAGEVYRATRLTYSGSLELIGSVSRSAKDSVYTASSAMTLAGSALRSSVIARSKSAAMTFSGLLEGVKTSIVDYFYRGYEGSLTLTGGIERLIEFSGTRFTLEASLSIYGRLTYIDAVLDRITAASVSPAGLVSWIVSTTRYVVTGDLELSGALGILRWFQKAGSGVVSFAGEVAGTTGGIWNYTTGGIIALSKAMSKALQSLRSYGGAVTSTGALSSMKDMTRSLAGAISFAGESIGYFFSGDWQSGVLSFAGVSSRYAVITRPAYASTLTVTGSLTRAVQAARAFTGAITPTSGAVERWKDILYYGPPNW
jgi:hypothetical protein